MGKYLRYRSTLLFCLILTTMVGLSLWLSRYIPEDYFDKVLTPILVICSSTISLIGAWIVFRHLEGYRFRKMWGYALLTWGILDGVYAILWLAVPAHAMNMGAYQLTTFELLLGNLLGWTLLLYPTEILRPGWLTARRALIQLLPLIAVAALDYAVPFNLQPVITLYPFILLALLIHHVRVYSVWCEDNFSSLEDIDVQWIIRYLYMVVLVGVVYMFLCLTHGHTRGFTQQWLVILLLGYGTDQILFRRDPWVILNKAEHEDEPAVNLGEAGLSQEMSAVYRDALVRWMTHGKPYQNMDFKLLDLRRVLPLDRDVLSQFIHDEFGCNFYHFVNGYRVEEAKRLMKAKPDMKILDISLRCGFSSPSVFSRVFTSFTGVTPSEWNKL